MKALITGASSGIGKCMAEYLALKNIDLILVARRVDILEDIKKNINNVNVEIIKCDVSKMDELEKLYNQTKDLNIDIMINNAGFGLFGTFDKTDLEIEMNMIDVNIKAVHYLTKKFLIDFKKRDYGYILNVASSAGFMAGPNLSTYYASKNYCLRLTQAIYQELKEAKSNVKISALCPGPVDTEFNKVANGYFSTGSITPEYVAKCAIDQMFKNKLIIIPTFKMKCAILFQRFVPMKIMLKITSDIQHKKEEIRK